MSDPGAHEALSRRLARRAIRLLVAARAPLARASLPKNDRSEPIDAATWVLVEDIARKNERARGEPLSVGRVRAEYDETGSILDLAPTTMARVEDFALGGGVHARVYTPRERSRAGGACLFFHGGGFVIGSPRSHDGLVRFLADATGAVLVSVDYRLGPEHRLPAAHDDALAAARWVRANATRLGLDADRIALAGDSAGGNLALATAIALRDEGEPAPRGVLAIYPTTDLGGRFASHRELGDRYFLTSTLLRFFADRFLASKEQVRSPRFSPLLTTNLSRLPRTHVVTAGFDPLRDEGEAMVTRLLEAGVACTHRYESGLIHGFATMGGVLPAAERAVRDVARALGAMLER